jgi:hypothetical protein
MELIEGHIYRATLPTNRKSPREYKVERVRDAELSIRYGWFGYEGSRGARKAKSPDDVWTWSPRGIERCSKYDFVPIEDFGPSPEEGDRRSEHPWAEKI